MRTRARGRPREPRAIIAPMPAPAHPLPPGTQLENYRLQRLLATGFSQGGILSFALASRHPSRIAHAFPVAGSCPGPLLPKEGPGQAAPISAFHGAEDDVLAIRWARDSVRAWNERGSHAELKEYPGVRHAISPSMRDDLWSALVSALDRSPGPDR